MSVVVNYRKFYEDLNRTRKARANISWHKVAVRVGMTPSGIATFVKQFESPTPKQSLKGLSLESFMQLLHWMRKTDVAPYIMDEDELDATVS